MFQIAICDDNKFICAELERILLELGKGFPDKIEVDVFYNGQDLCRFMQNGYEADVLFLDIEMEQLNGIEVGKRIRDGMNNEQVQIVYISDYESYAMELFQNRPLHFLKKPLEEQAVRDVVQKAWTLLEKQKQYYCYMDGKGMYKVLIQDILYFNSRGKKIVLHTTNGEREFYGKLSDVTESLQDYNFITTHKSYFIHFAYISEIRRNEVLLTNGEVLPVSNSKREDMQQFIAATMKGRKM